MEEVQREMRRKECSKLLNSNGGGGEAECRGRDKVEMGKRYVTEKVHGQLDLVSSNVRRATGRITRPVCRTQMFT